MNQQKEFFMVDAFLKYGIDETLKYSEFSGYFQNIKELQSFLRFAKYFTGGSITLNLGIAFKSWKEINKKEVTMVKTIDEIIARMKTIRDIVKADDTKANDYWREYHELETDLRKLDPYNSELNIGIHGKPYFAGLKD